MFCKKTGSRAFTLIEMSIILAIAGVFMALFISFIKPYYAEKIRLKNVAALQTVEDALSRYVAKYNRYPCPASPSAARGTADDGLPFCSRGKGVVATAGFRNRDNLVLIGAVPYRELNISANSTVDGYFNRLTYAVTFASTDDSTYNNEPDPTKLSGQIAILKTDDPANKTSMIPIPGGAHYFVFSRGRNGIGGYTDGGVFNAGLCPANEAENCNNDSTFASASVAYGAGNRYFDDLSTYNLPKNDEDGGTTPPPVAKNDEFWEETSPGSNDITNIHGRNVVINHPDPANPRVALEVKGPIGLHLDLDDRRRISRYCNSSLEGSIRVRREAQLGVSGDIIFVSDMQDSLGHSFENVGPQLEFCDGQKWKPVSPYNCSDNPSGVDASEIYKGGSFGSISPEPDLYQLKYNNIVYSNRKKTHAYSQTFTIDESLDCYALPVLSDGSNSPPGRSFEFFSTDRRSLSEKLQYWAEFQDADGNVLLEYYPRRFSSSRVDGLNFNIEPTNMTDSTGNQIFQYTLMTGQEKIEFIKHNYPEGRYSLDPDGSLVLDRTPLGERDPIRAVYRSYGMSSLAAQTQFHVDQPIRIPKGTKKIVLFISGFDQGGGLPSSADQDWEIAEYLGRFSLVVR